MQLSRPVKSRTLRHIVSRSDARTVCGTQPLASKTRLESCSHISWEYAAHVSDQYGPPLFQLLSTAYPTQGA
jgi:hypothetical protein